MSESLTLYQLEEELMECFQHVTQLQAEGNEEDLAAAMQALELYIKESVAKRDRVGRFMQTLVSTEQAIDNEIGRLNERKQRIANTQKRMRSYLLLVMSRMGVEKLEGEVFSFRKRQNPPKVVIDDPEKIPPFYLRLPEPKPPELEPDKAAIKDAIQDGHEVPGAHLEQETRLVIDQ